MFVRLLPISAVVQINLNTGRRRTNSAPSFIRIFSPFGHLRSSSFPFEVRLKIVTECKIKEIDQVR